MFVFHSGDHRACQHLAGRAFLPITAKPLDDEIRAVACSSFRQLGQWWETRPAIGGPLELRFKSTRQIEPKSLKRCRGSTRSAGSLLDLGPGELEPIGRQGASQACKRRSRKSGRLRTGEHGIGWNGAALAEIEHGQHAAVALDAVRCRLVPKLNRAINAPRLDIPPVAGMQIETFELDSDAVPEVHAGIVEIVS